MPNPEISASGGVFRFKFAQGVIVQIDKIRDDPRTGITGEILVRAGQPIGHIHQVRYSLLGTRSRKDVAQFCASRLEGFDWDAILEQASVETVRLFRAGEPIVRLGDVAITEGIDYRLMPFLVEKEANLIYGEGGLGKSMIAAFFATLVQEAVVLGEVAPEPGPVLYLDYEASKEDQAKRFAKIYHGLDLGKPVEVYHRFCHLALQNDIQELQRAIVERDIQLVIIDSAAPACGGEPEAAAAVIPFFNALRSLRVTSLIVAHKAKNNANGMGPFGSVFWMNLPRNVFEIKKAQEVDGDTIHLLLRHVKANNGTLLPPKGVRLLFRGDAIIVASENASDVPEFEEELPLADRVSRTLRDGSMTVASIAEELRVSDATIRVILNRHRDKRFTRIGNAWGNAYTDGGA